MGAVVAAASLRGLVTGGRSPFFQAVLAGLQAHVLSHLAVSVRLRGYSTGVVTAVLLVAPWSVWARRVLRVRGVLVEGRRPHLQGALLLVPLAVGCHALARVVLRSPETAVAGSGPLSPAADGR